MIKRDYLLAQIEAIGKMYSKLIEKLEARDPYIFDYTDECYAIFGVDINFIQEASVDEILSKVGYWEVVEHLVRVIVEDKRLNSNHYILDKAHSLLATIQELDRTYSQPRIELVARVEDLLAKNMEKC